MGERVISPMRMGVVNVETTVSNVALRGRNVMMANGHLRCGNGSPPPIWWKGSLVVFGLKTVHHAN